MKKILVLMFVFALFRLSVVCADSNYHAYERVEMVEGKLLSEYSKDDYSTYYKEVSKRRFMGWRVHFVTTDAKMVYKTETLFSYYNDGHTPIKYDYAYSQVDSAKTQLSTSGGISISTKGDIKKFKNGLDANIKVDYSQTKTIETKESWSMKMDIDPGTMVNLYILGEGKISNGVASRYAFWINAEKGGFEVFTVTTQYYRLEKIQI